MVVMFVLLFMTKVFELLPYAVMAAIIISGVAGLVEFDTAAYLFRTHLRDFAVWMVAFVSTLFLGIELGLGVSIGLALLIVIFESAFPHTAMLGRVDRSTVYRNIEQVHVWSQLWQYCVGWWQGWCTGCHVERQPLSTAQQFSMHAVSHPGVSTWHLLQAFLCSQAEKCWHMLFVCRTAAFTCVC
jgi:MFS superfamily sulfate permease-like transporter